MSEIRTDPLFGNVTIVARERVARPHRMRIQDEIDSQGPCPLCPGNEGLAPPEVARIEGTGGTGRWETRAFPNRYPAVSLEAEPVMTDVNSPPESFRTVPGFGVHEVIVDSPNHTLPFWYLDPQQGVQTLQLIQGRITDLYKDQRLLSIQVYKNHRAGSGGSIEHPHFQLIGLPFIPPPALRLISRKDCAVCALLAHEQPKARHSKRFLAETSLFIALADFAPSYPYQFSIYPKSHQNGFEAVQESGLEELSQLFSLVFGRFERLMGDFAMNLVLFTQPNPEGFARPKTVYPWEKSMHWFFRAYPRVARHAGFEISTGVPIVQVSPEDAARAFREKGV